MPRIYCTAAHICKRIDFVTCYTCSFSKVALGPAERRIALGLGLIELAIFVMNDDRSATDDYHARDAKAALHANTNALDTSQADRDGKTIAGHLTQARRAGRPAAWSRRNQRTAQSRNHLHCLIVTSTLVVHIKQV